MNWKYILIVIVLTVIVGGAVLVYQHYSALQDNKGTIDSFIPDETHFVTGVSKFVANFMEARLERNQPLAESFLTDNAKKQYSQSGLTLVGTSNPHFADFEILEREQLGNNQFSFKVRIYEEYTGQGRVGYFDETLNVIKSEDKYLIDSVKRSEYTNL